MEYVVNRIAQRRLRALQLLQGPLFLRDTIFVNEMQQRYGYIRNGN